MVGLHLIENNDLFSIVQTVGHVFKPEKGISNVRILFLYAKLYHQVNLLVGFSEWYCPYTVTTSKFHVSQFYSSDRFFEFELSVARTVNTI